MSAPCVLAIDPGLTGAIAFYHPSAPDLVAVDDMPVAGGEVDALTLAAQIRMMAPDLGLVERVNAMPGGGKRKMGATSAFNFGCSYAIARTVVSLCGVPLHLVQPAAWKRAYALGGGPESKEAARALALRLFPGSAGRFARKKDAGRAEAALMAKFAADTLFQVPAVPRSGCAGEGSAASAVLPNLP